MCGIIGMYIKKPYKNQAELCSTLYDLYYQQSSRGSEGFGMAYHNIGQPIRRVRYISDVGVFGSWNAKHFENINKTGTFMVFHHRFPTSQPNKSAYNHPIMNEAKDIALIHNGIINNDDELYKELKATHTFETAGEGKFNDSEVLVHTYESKKNLQEQIQEVENKVSGLIAYILLDEKKDKMIAYKRNNPIVLSESDNALILTSEFDDEDLKNTGITKVRELASNEAISINRKGKIEKIEVKAFHHAYTYPTTYYRTSCFDEDGYYFGKKGETTITTPKTNPKILEITHKIQAIGKQIGDLAHKNTRAKKGSKKYEGREKEINKLQAKILKLVTEKNNIEEGKEINLEICDKCGDKKPNLLYHQELDVMLCPECYKTTEGLTEWRCSLCDKKIEEVTFMNGEPFCDECSNRIILEKDKRLGDYF